MYKKACNKVYIYICNLHMHLKAYIYGCIYPYMPIYMQHLGAQEVRETSLQCIHTQEAGACYTKLTQLRCNATQLPRRGLQHQPSYPNMQ